MKLPKIKETKNIKFGSVEIPDEAFEPKNVKMRVTTFIDLDIVLELKKKAKQSKVKYQTLLNQTLRSAVMEEKGVLTEAKIRKIIREELRAKK